MKTKAQQGPVSFVMMTIFTIIVLGLIGGQILGIFSLAALLGNVSGFALFILSNFAVWFFFAIVMSVILYFWRMRK